MRKLSFLLHQLGLATFLAPLAKGNVSFFHHLASVVRSPLTFHILIFSSEITQPNELKLDRKHLWKLLSKDCPFYPQAILVSDWPIKKKYSPLKPLGPMK